MRTIVPEASWLEQRYSLALCTGCDVPFVAVEYEEEVDGPYSAFSAPIVVWPSRHRELSMSIPAGVRGVLEEARTCFGAKAFSAAVVMVRRTLEGLCQDLGVQGQNLHQALRTLADRRLLDDRLIEWAQSLKAIGNVGAHYSAETISRLDAQDALELAEAILDYVYVFTAKYEAFKTRRTTPADVK